MPIQAKHKVVVGGAAATGYNGVDTVTPNFSFMMARSLGMSKVAVRRRLLAPGTLNRLCRPGQGAATSRYVYDKIMLKSKRKYACTANVQTQSFKGRSSVRTAGAPRFLFREWMMETNTFPPSRLIHIFSRFVDRTVKRVPMARSWANGATLADQITAAAELFPGAFTHHKHKPAAERDLMKTFIFNLTEMYLYLGKDAEFLQKVTELRKRCSRLTAQRFSQAFETLKRQHLPNGWLTYSWQIVPEEAKAWAIRTGHPQASHMVTLSRASLLAVFYRA
eukprot:jgi/Ulvmu1/10265/UM060_0066.1